MSTSVPPVPVSLGRVAGDMYNDHVKRRPAPILVNGWPVPCECSTEKPDPRCDLGWALSKMRDAEQRRFDDGRNPRR